MTSMENSHRCLWFDMICLIKYGLSVINVYYFKHGIILNCGFSTKVTCVFLVQEILKELSEKILLNYKPRKRQFVHCIDQKKVSTVLLWFGICYLCLEGHLKLRLQWPLKKFGLILDGIFSEIFKQQNKPFGQ